MIHHVGVFACHCPIAHVLIIGYVGLLIGRRELGQCTAAQHLECVHHCSRKALSILLTREVQAINIFCVAPLMKGGGGLIIFQSFEYRAVDDDFVILQLAADDSECVVLNVMKDLHFAETAGGAAGHPFLHYFIVNHHGCSRTDDTLFG